jgi:hypothetical protein
MALMIGSGSSTRNVEGKTRKPPAKGAAGGNLCRGEKTVAKGTKSFRLLSSLEAPFGFMSDKIRPENVNGAIDSKKEGPPR